MSLVKTLVWGIVVIAIVVVLIYASCHPMRTAVACVAVPLMVGGALGGLAQSLISANGKLTMPFYDVAAKPPAVNVGTVADVFIGIVGAIAALLLGATLLNPEMLNGKTSAPTQTASAAASASPAATTDKSNALPTIPAWLRILSFGALAGFGARALLPDMAKRFGAWLGSAPVQNAINQHVQSAVDKSTQSQRENLSSAVEVARLEPLRPSLAGGGVPAMVAAQQQQPIDRLRQEVERYALAVSNTDKGVRNQQRSDLAQEMLGVCFANNISAANIAAQIPGEHNNGWGLALSTLIARAPVLGDGARLIVAAPHVQDNYVRFRFCLALFSLKSANLLTAEEVRGAQEMLSPWTVSPDESLRRKAQATLDFISA